MATTLDIAAELREENPYAAPQTRDLVLPAALASEKLQATRTSEVIPDSTRRWLMAALISYVIAFVVPSFGWFDRWLPFGGVYLFVAGAVYCWYPLMFPWWANVFFFLSRRNIQRGRSQRAWVYAGTGVLAAASFMVGGAFDHDFNRMILNPPYLCWLAAMILQWVAAVDMRQFNKSFKDER